MNDAVEYGARGTLGLLVPQANTTAEPEVQAMLGCDIALLTGRLTSPQPELRERLIDFLNGIEGFIETFANAPLSGLGFLITGSTYHWSPEQEDAFFAALSQKYGYPIISAGQSIRRAFETLQVKRVGLVSPYPQWLTEMSAAYWQRAGVEIVGIESPNPVGGFHSIYTLRNPEVLAAAKRLIPAKPDVILLAGAGMPTLGPIMALADMGIAAISSNFCMTWQLNQIESGQFTDKASLLALMSTHAAWRDIFAQRFPGAAMRAPRSVCASMTGVK